MARACSINIITEKNDQTVEQKEDKCLNELWTNTLMTLKTTLNDVKLTSKYVRYGIISK